MGWIITSGKRKPEFEAILNGNFKAEWSDVTDTAGYYDGTEVETVLAEVGQELLQHNLGGFEDRTASTLSWEGTAYTLTLTPATTDYYWCAGVRYSYSSAKTCQISDVSGVHVVYFDGTSFTSVANPTHAQLDTVIVDKCIVAYIYWNTNDDTYPILADERHGVEMSGETHHFLHDNIGARWRSGGTMSGYTLNDDSDTGVSVAVTDIEFYDEDLKHDIENAATADTQYEQILRDTAFIPILYRDDVDGTWKEDAASALPYKIGAALLAYNKDDGDGTFSQQELSNNQYMNYFLVATNDWQTPVKMIQGSTSYAGAGAVAGAAAGQANEIAGWSTLPAAEMVVLYGIVCQTSSAFGGTKKMKIVDVIDYRYQEISGGSYSPTDHGVLSGLGDDDHTQYIAHVLATAADDFLVASASGTFVKKTLAETGAILEGDIQHDNLQGVVADQHKDHSGISAIAGGILSGGGTIDTDFTITLASADVDHDAASNYVANEHIDHTAVTITAGNALTGGGDISANRTIDLVGGKGIGVAADSCYIDVTDTDWLLDEDNFASDSASHCATQQSIKAYVDAAAGTPRPADPGADRILIWDDSASDWVWATPTNGVQISGTNVQVDTSWLDAHSAALDGAVFSGAVQIANAAPAYQLKETDYDSDYWQIYVNNGVLNLARYDQATSAWTYSFGLGATGELNLATSTCVKDEDTLASDSATHLATQQSIKAYADRDYGQGYHQKAYALITASVTSYTIASGLDTNYDRYKLILYNIGHTVANEPMMIQLGNSSGWKATAYDMNIYAHGGGGQRETTAFACIVNTYGATAYRYVVMMDIWRFANTGNTYFAQSQSFRQSYNNAIFSQIGHCVLGASLTQIRLVARAGTSQTLSNGYVVFLAKGGT